MSESPAQVVLRGGAPACLPVAPVVGADHAAFRAGVRLRDAMSDPGRLADVLLAAREDYGSDLLVVFSDVAVEAEALGAEVLWPEGEPPRVARPPGLDRLRPLDPARDGRLPVVIGAARRAATRLAGRAPVLVSLKGPFSLAALLGGHEGLVRDALSRPERAREAIAAATECQRGYLRAILETGGIPLIGDPFATGTLLGPARFRELALPGLESLVAEAHRHGVPAGIHICGDTTALLDDLAEAGADLLHLETADLHAAAELAVVMGGVPTETLLGDEAGVAAAVRAAVGGAPRRDRFVLATACDVPTAAPPGNVRALVRAGRAAG